VTTCFAMYRGALRERLEHPTLNVTKWARKILEDIECSIYQARVP